MMIAWNQDYGRTEALSVGMGPEETEAARRSSELAGRPRPLTDDESTELRATLAAVLADLRATGAILPDIREKAHDRSGRSRS